MYSGEQFDSKIGQQYLRARYYDPATGRFNRLDPFFGNLNDPQSLHKYLYTHADPINRVDANGMQSGGVMSVLSRLNWLQGANFDAYSENDIKGAILPRDIKSKPAIPKLEGDKRLKITEALTASHLVYDPSTISVVGWSLVREPWKKNGLTAVLYKSPNNKLILAFSGTNEIRDWRDNFGQALGLNSPQYLLVESVVKEAKEYGVIDTITGHSLGGGLATLATIVYSKVIYDSTVGDRLVIFNPAYLHEKTISNTLGENTLPEDFFNDSHFWRVQLDPLYMVQEVPSIIPNWLHKLPNATVIAFTNPIPFNLPQKMRPAKLHSLELFDAYFEKH